MKQILLLSLAANLILAILLFRECPLPSGGGQVERENGFRADAMSLKASNPLCAKNVFYEFTINEDKDNSKAFARITFEGPKTTECNIMRSYPRVIKWSNQGQNVTFTTPELEITVKDFKKLIKDD